MGLGEEGGCSGALLVAWQGVPGVAVVREVRRRQELWQVAAAGASHPCCWLCWGVAGGWPPQLVALCISGRSAPFCGLV
jgi:hypothetical protein